MAVSVQQASLNAAVAYLKTKITSATIHSRWPGIDFPGDAITLITAGSRHDTALDPRILSAVNQGSTQTSAVWQIAECTQPLQLDVWSTSFLGRDNIIAQLDTYLRAGQQPIAGNSFLDPVGNGFFVALADGFDAFQTTAKFSFSGPDHEDSPDSVTRSQFRATYRGTLYAKLAIPAVTYRQKTFHLNQVLNGLTF